jgi:hypothetical protein
MSSFARYRPLLVIGSICLLLMHIALIGIAFYLTIEREQGTNRNRYFRGQMDKYTRVDLGSSYLPSDVFAAFLFAQFVFL